MKKVRLVAGIMALASLVAGNAAFADITGNWSSTQSTVNVPLSATVPQLIRLTVFDGGADSSTLSVTGQVDSSTGLSMPNLVIKGKVETNLTGVTVSVNNNGSVLLKKNLSDTSGITYNFPATVSGLNNNSTFQLPGVASGITNDLAFGTYTGTVMLTAAKP